LTDGGGDGAHPLDLRAIENEGRVNGIGAGEGDLIADAGAAEDAEEDLAANVIVDADDDAVAGARGGVGIGHSDFAIGVEGLHGVASDADGEGTRVGDAEGEVFAGELGGVFGGGEEEGVALGEEGDDGDACGGVLEVRRCGEGFGRRRGGGGGFGAIHFALHAFDEFDEGLGSASAVFDFGDVLAADAHHDGEFRAGDAELVAEGFNARGEVGGGGRGFWGGFGRGRWGELDLVQGGEGRGGEAGLQRVRREWGVHGEPVAEGFGLEFFHEADEMKGGGLAAVFELTEVSGADVEPAREFGLRDAEFGAEVRTAGGEADEVVEVKGGG
jgi:hypothetical protein